MAPTASIYIDDAVAAPFLEFMSALGEQAQKGDGEGEGEQECQRGEGAGRRGGHCGRGRGGAWGWGGPWAHGPWGGAGGPWAARREEWRRRHEGQDFTPAVDVFDTKDAYVVHVSLPGANKEDIGINYDYDDSELQISGVVHKPGDEEFLKTISQSERKSGAFERRIKLGDSRNPAAVEADGITAKLENGILEVTIPKKEKEPDQEKRKIEIE